MFFQKSTQYFSETVVGAQTASHWYTWKRLKGTKAEMLHIITKMSIVRQIPKIFFSAIALSSSIPLIWIVKQIKWIFFIFKKKRLSFKSQITRHVSRMLSKQTLHERKKIRMQDKKTKIESYFCVLSHFYK